MCEGVLLADALLKVLESKPLPMLYRKASLPCEVEMGAATAATETALTTDSRKRLHCEIDIAGGSGGGGKVADSSSTVDARLSSAIAIDSVPGTCPNAVGTSDSDGSNSVQSGLNSADGSAKKRQCMHGVSTAKQSCTTSSNNQNSNTTSPLESEVVGYEYTAACLQCGKVSYRLLPMSCLRLNKILGHGQTGDVYLARYGLMVMSQFVVVAQSPPGINQVVQQD
jgi:hypothetical protein